MPKLCEEGLEMQSMLFLLICRLTVGTYCISLLGQEVVFTARSARRIPSMHVCPNTAKHLGQITTALHTSDYCDRCTLTASQPQTSLRALEGQPCNLGYLWNGLEFSPG